MREFNSNSESLKIRETKETEINNKATENITNKKFYLLNELIRPIFNPEVVNEELQGILENSMLKAKSFEEKKEMSPQLLGDLSERLVLRMFAGTGIGEIVKLKVNQEAGNHTADCLLKLHKPLSFNGKIFSPGQKIIIEVKNGETDYVYRELKDTESHARMQLKETIKRENADAMVCFASRECQNYPELFSRIREDLKSENIFLNLCLPEKKRLNTYAEKLKN
ncbi:MAG TPA: hypothetical protein PKY81_07350 [bacterium]|nr:hypothetical protein [bacterium]